MFSEYLDTLFEVRCRICAGYNSVKVRMQPKVTVYIPTRNRGNLLDRAINSVASQSYRNIELIIVDDGSVDRTQMVIDAYRDKLDIISLVNEKSLGACVSRNKAIHIASGYFVTGLDDDDFFSDPNRIMKFVEAWKARPAENSAFFDSFRVITPKGFVERQLPAVVKEVDLRSANMIGNQVFARKAAYIKAGLFDPEMPAWQDWDLWRRMSEQGVEFFNIGEFSSTVDESHAEDRITLNDGAKIRAAKKIFVGKCNNLSVREKSSIALSMLAYPCVRPNFRDLCFLLITFRLRSFVKCAKKSTFWSSNSSSALSR